MPPTRIAVLTSGGDAPGMNAAVRAVVRAGVARGFEVLGIEGGFTGLIEGRFRSLGNRDVGGIIARGGTILGTTRCERLRTEAGQCTAIEQYQRAGLTGLVVVGGNGSQSGAAALAARGAAVVGVASTIDNDLAGVELSIGATTALDTVCEAIDRLRVTAAATRRVFLVEVMGRDTGHLALAAGIVGGAEAVVLPEVPLEPEALAGEILASYERGKSHAIVVVAEGAQHGAAALALYFKEHHRRLGFELRITVLGHIQRGGAPVALDRMIATQLGCAAVDCLAERQAGVLLGISASKVQTSALAALSGARKPLDAQQLAMFSVLAR